MKFQGTDQYVATDDLKLAVNAALKLQRPLLVKGEPGTGKTMLAEQVSEALGMPLLRLEALTLQFVWAGFIMLSLTLLLGLWFTTAWRWDHKSVFSVLSWVVFATLLVGRVRFS